jgi:hypothetical protein
MGSWAFGPLRDLDRTPIRRCSGESRTRRETVVARISKRWFRVRDTYGVEIDAGEDEALMLAVVALESLTD